MFLPEPYPDELLYSVWARYHYRSRNNSYKETMHQLFGKFTACAVMDFPSHLTAFCERLPDRFALSPDFLINHHTLFPLYKPFLPPERTGNIIESMKSDNGGGIHTSLGVMASSLPSIKNLRYCPQCIVDDESIFGEPYWHRSHQVYGVYICSIHRQWLKCSKCVISSQQNKHEFQLIKICYDDASLIPLYGFERQSLYFNISNDVYWLLNNPVSTIKPQEIRNIYLSYLQHKDFVTGGARIRQKELMDEFSGYYGSALHGDFLSKVNHSPDNWLSKLLRKPRTTIHPLRHLLFMNYLGLSPETFFQNRHSSIEPLTNLYNDKKDQQRSFPSNFTQIIERHRANWLNTMQINPEMNRKMLRLMAYAEYAWLYRNDREWLKEHQPPIQKKIKPPKQRVDWVKRDLELAEKVKLAGIGLLFDSNRMVQLTKSSIGKEIGELMLIQKHLSKLPKTKVMLDLLVETEEQFRCRRVRRAVRKLIQTGKTVNRWRLIRESRLRPDFSRIVDLEIEKVINMGMELN